MKVKIITDSTCDLPQDLIKEHEIDVVPLFVHIDDKAYRDGIDITPEQVFSAIRDGKVPTTSQVTPETFLEVFEPYARQGVPCIYLAFSSRLSGTCQSGVLAVRQLKEKYPNTDISVVDTRSGSVGQGLVVLEAAKLSAAGKSKKEIVDRARQVSSHMVHLFTVDDLVYLQRGGRVSKTTAFIGSLLKIKPLLQVENGEMIPIEKIRGNLKALKRLVELAEEKGANLRDQIVGISHANDFEMAKKLKSMLETTLGCQQFVINNIGSVLGAHIGLGGVAAFFVAKAPNNPEAGEVN